MTRSNLGSHLSHRHIQPPAVSLRVMPERKPLSMSLIVTPDLIDAITPEGRGKALPLTFIDDDGQKTVNVPVPDGDDDAGAQVEGD